MRGAVCFRSGRHACPVVEWFFFFRVEALCSGACVGLGRRYPFQNRAAFRGSALGCAACVVLFPELSSIACVRVKRRRLSRDWAALFVSELSGAAYPRIERRCLYQNWAALLFADLSGAVCLNIGRRCLSQVSAALFVAYLSGVAGLKVELRCAFPGVAALFFR